MNFRNFRNAGYASWQFCKTEETIARKNQSSKPELGSQVLSQSAFTRALFNASSLTPLNFQIRRLYDRFLLTGKLKVANIKLWSQLAGGLRVPECVKRTGESDIIKSRIDSLDAVIRVGSSIIW